MDFKEAMKKRHVVRRYRDEELDSETVSALKKRVEEDNEKYQVHVKLETEDSSALNLMGKLPGNVTSKRMSKQSVHTRVKHRTGSLPV